jgi:L-noviosyl transferase
MRVLLTTTPDRGHLFPMVPLAWALRCAGHHVLITGPEATAHDTRNAGLEHVTTSEHAEHRAADTIDLVSQWRPHIVISDPSEQTGPLAATLSGIPTARHQCGLHPSESTDAEPDHTDIPHEKFGLLPEETYPATTIDLCPPSLHQLQPDENVLSLRHTPFGGGGTPAPWLWCPHAHPRVCISLGTTPTVERDHCLRALAEELSDLDGEVVVTGVDRTAGNPVLPGHMRTAPWLPHDQVLPTCDVIVHHGGSAVAMNALRFGLPQLLLPRTGGQKQNAHRLVQCGLARSVDLGERPEGLLRQEVEWLLAERAHRAHALRVRAEIEEMPAPGQVVAELEELAAAGHSRGPAAAGVSGGTLAIR